MSAPRARTFQGVPVEKVQGYWDSRPCNIRHSNKPIGSRDYFDEVESRKYFVEPHIPDFAEFERWRGKKVLEIGCGIGTDSIVFARHGAQVTAVDISGRSVEVASQRADVFGLSSQIRFYQANAESLSEYVPVDTYDLVYSFGVVHHTPHPERVLEEIRKYTGPGSTLKIMVYHRRSWKVLQILLKHGRGRFWRLDQLVATHSEAQTGCPVTYTYTKRRARQLLERHGFHVTNVRVEHIFPYKIKDYIQYRYNVVWYFRWLPRRVFRWFERRVGWHLCLTAQAPR